MDHTNSSEQTPLLPRVDSDEPPKRSRLPTFIRAQAYPSVRPSRDDRYVRTLTLFLEPGSLIRLFDTLNYSLGNLTHLVIVSQSLLEWRSQWERWHGEKRARRNSRRFERCQGVHFSSTFLCDRPGHLGFGFLIVRLCPC